MTTLKFYDSNQPDAPLGTYTDFDAIAALLRPVGIGFDRWDASQPLPSAPRVEQVEAAYGHAIERLMQTGGYRSWDLIAMQPEHPDREAMRAKFLEEHTHSEDEVRFFVAGAGQFNLHIGERVYSLVCTQGDLIQVPAGTRHWFDMGPAPEFIAIRLFTNPEGWVAEFTGDPLAERLPRFVAQAQTESP